MTLSSTTSPIRGAPQHSLQARLLQKCADAAALIVDQQNLRRPLINPQNFADDAVGGNDCHIRFDAVVRAFIDIDDPRSSLPLDPITCAASVFEINCSLNASRDCNRCACSASSLKRTCSGAVVRSASFSSRFSCADSAQVKIVVPEVAGAVLRPDQDFFQRGDDVDTPTRGSGAWFSHLAAAFDLNREAQNLKKQDSHQKTDVTIAADKDSIKTVSSL